VEKSVIQRENLKNHKTVAYFDKPRSKESDASVIVNLLPAVKLLHRIYLDNLSQTAKSKAV